MTTNLLDHQMKGFFPAARNQAIIFNISIKVQPPVYAQGPQSKLCILMLNFNTVFSKKLMT